jgi:replicative DNA helicase
MMTQRIPIAPTAEAGALSCLSYDRNAMSSLNWTKNLFALEAHQLIFEAMERVHRRSGACGGVATIAELEGTGLLEFCGGREGVSQILKTISLSGGGIQQADDFRHQLVKARSYRAVLKLISENDDDLRWMRADLASFGEKIAEEGCVRGDAKNLKEHLSELIDDLEGKTPIERFGSGLRSFDRLMRGGISRGEMLVVGAQTSGGKSILLGQFALSALESGKSVAVFSLEMPAKQTLHRLASARLGKPILTLEEAQQFHDPRNAASGAEIADAVGWLAGSRLTVRDDLHEVGEIIAEANRLAISGKADLVIVDYLQIIEAAKADTRELAISEAARRLKLASIKGCYALATASQLNEAGLLRESRAIGMHADYVVKIEHDGGACQLILGKQRNGPRDVFADVQMRGHCFRFEGVKP